MQYYVVKNKETGMYFRGKGANMWGKYYNQASIYRFRKHAENAVEERVYRGEQAEVVEIQITEGAVTDTNVGCKWISCSERLPDESGKYLVQCRNRANANIYFEVAHVNVWSDGKKTCLVDGEPMAWQDLPEPYREGDV